MTGSIVQIGDFCQTGSGGTPNRADAFNFDGGTVPWVKSGELKSRFVERAEESITEAALNSSAAKLVPKGALLVAMYGATVGEVSELKIDAATNQAVCHIVPDPVRCDRDYLFHALVASKPTLLSRRVGGAQPNISQGIIKSLKIPLPPVPEQRRIAAILETADALRAKRREAIAKLDQLLQSVFLDMFGDPVTNPRGWPLVELGSLVSDGPQNGLYKPASDYGSGTPILRIDGFRAGDVIDDLPAKRVRLDITDVAKYQLRHADLVINRVNSPEHLGKPALIGELSEPVVFESNMMRLTLDQGRVSPKYLLKALLQQNVRDQISRRRKDAVNQSSINQTDVSTLTITLPPVGVQEKFAAAVLACEKQRQFFASWTRASDALFASMQGGAFSGPP